MEDKALQLDLIRSPGVSAARVPSWAGKQRSKVRATLHISW